MAAYSLGRHGVGCCCNAHLLKVEIDLLQRFILLLQRHDVGCGSVLHHHRCCSTLVLRVASSCFCGTVGRVVLHDADVGAKEIEIVVRMYPVPCRCRR